MDPNGLTVRETILTTYPPNHPARRLFERGGAKPRRGSAGPRRQAGTMNATERAYSQMLDQRKAKGEVRWYAFEKIKLKLADKTHYTCDFAVLLADGRMEMHEVKGHWEDDARVKIKVAAELFPCFTFIAIRLDRKRGWIFETFKGGTL